MDRGCDCFLSHTFSFICLYLIAIISAIILMCYSYCQQEKKCEGCTYNLDTQIQYLKH